MIAKYSLSYMGQLRSVSEKVWEINPTSLTSLGLVGSRWNKIAPLAKHDASTSNSNCHVVSGGCSIGTVVMDCMSFPCASFCSGPQVKGASFLVRSVSGLAIFAKLGIKARRYPTTPRKLRMSFFPLSVRGHSVIPFIFAGSIATPFDDRFIPKKGISGAIKIDLLNLR